MSKEKRKPRNDIYGDNEHPGLGKLKCAVCGDPLRDHKISEPCPGLNLQRTDRMTVGSRQERRVKKQGDQ